MEYNDVNIDKFIAVSEYYRDYFQLHWNDEKLKGKY